MAGQTGQAVASPRNSNNSISAANLLKNLDSDKKDGTKIIDSSVNPDHELTQKEWADVISYLASDSPKIIAIADANNLDAFALYPPFRHHNGLPMVVVLEQVAKTKRSKKAYVITAFGEYDEVTRRKTFLYGSYNKIKGIPTVRDNRANPGTTTSWQIPFDGKDTKNSEIARLDAEYLSAVKAGDMEKAQKMVSKPAPEKTGRQVLYSKKKALKTAVPGGFPPFKATVISSASGAKILNSHESYAEKAKNLDFRDNNAFLKNL